MFRTVTAVLMALVMLAGLSAVSQAQSRAIITGTVTESEDGQPLPSANVYLDGTGMGAVASQDGRYRIANVPAGTYTLKASYIGYENIERTITLTGGQVTTQDFELDSELIPGGEVVVTGQREGQVRALNTQKNAPNIQNVVSEDMIERFPDPNMAEAVQRIPGVSIQRDQGEGRYVLIRGLDARLNSVTIDGERLPSPEGDVRSVALDVIPSDLISSIELNKAITPDMDADAIGGSINLVTKSASDYTGRVLKGKLGSGYSDLTGDPNGQLSLTWGDRFGPDRKLGIIVSGNYYKTYRGSDNNEFEYTEEDFGNGNVWTLETYEMRDYTVTRLRSGLSGTIDYEFNEDNNIYFTGIYNYFSDNEFRRRLTFEAEDYTSQYSTTDGVVVRDLKDRFEAQNIMSFAVGGENRFDLGLPISMDYRLSYSYAQEEEPDRQDLDFELEGVDFSWSKDHDFPKFTVDNDADINDYSSYEFHEYETNDNLTTDTDIIASANFMVPVEVMSYPGEVKFGGKIRHKTKDRENEIKIYGWDGADDYTLDMIAGDYDNDDFLDGNYSMGLMPDPGAATRHFRSNFADYEYEEEDSIIDTNSENYDATEDILAGYIQGAVNIDNLMLLGGVRLENTSIDYNGYRVVVNEDGDYVGTTKVSDTNGYLNAFPMIHARYAIDEDTNVRAALTTSIARPNYFSLVPYNLINREDEEIERGNPELDPTTAIGFDLLAEHYIRPVGIISGGFFYKTLDNYIFEQVIEEDGGQYDGYEVSTWRNGDTASLYGFELNWQHELTFLPGHLNGLGVYANYTYTDSDATIPIDVDETRDATLPGQSEHMGNVSLAYSKFGFTGRISINFHGSYIDAVGETAQEDEYYDDHTQIDISLQQEVYEGVSLFADLINITDEPLRYYYGTSSRPRQQEYYRFWAHFGVKFAL